MKSAGNVIDVEQVDLELLKLKIYSNDVDIVMLMDNLKTINFILVVAFFCIFNYFFSKKLFYAFNFL